MDDNDKGGDIVWESVQRSFSDGSARVIRVAYGQEGQDPGDLDESEVRNVLNKTEGLSNFPQIAGFSTEVGALTLAKYA